MYGQAAPSDGQVEPAAQVEVPGYGFCVHAERRVSAHDRAGRERLCRYVHRPPLAQRRLEVLSNGNVRLGLKRAFRDGTVVIVVSGLELLARLALLVPPPRVHTTRYFGVWAARSSLRRLVVPQSPQATEGSPDDHEAKNSDRCEHGHRYRLSWAQALAKVFAVDVTVCSRCGQRGMQQVSAIHDTRVLRAIQAAIGQRSEREKKPP